MGYEIVDHTKLNPELGGEAGFERLSQALRQYDLGLILDFVPKPCRRSLRGQSWWLDVLEWARASPHAYPSTSTDLLPYRARGGVLLPIIVRLWAGAGNGEIELRYDADEGSFSAWYFEHRLPIAPERYSEMLRMIVKQAPPRRRRRQANPCARVAYRGCAIPIARRAPRLQDGAEGDRPRAGIIARGARAYRAGPIRATPTLALHHLLEVSL